MINKLIRKWKKQMIEKANANSVLLPTKKGNIQYTVYGEGVPLIYMHPSPGGCDSGRILYQLLGEDHGYKVITPSRPGFLKTSLNIGRTVSDQAKMVIQLMDELGIEKAFLYAAGSGGAYALKAAELFPERFFGVVMCCASHYEWKSKFNYTQKLMVKDQVMWFTWVFYKMFKRNFRRKVCKDFGIAFKKIKNDKLKMNMLDAILESNMPSSLRNLGTWNDLNNDKIAETIHFTQIYVPVMVIETETDRQLPSKHGTHLSELLPKSELYHARDGGHFPLLGHDSNRLIEAIKQFTRSHIMSEESLQSA